MTHEELINELKNALDQTGLKYHLDAISLTKYNKSTKTMKYEEYHYNTYGSNIKQTALVEDYKLEYILNPILNLIEREKYLLVAFNIGGTNDKRLLYFANTAYTLLVEDKMNFDTYINSNKFEKYTNYLNYSSFCLITERNKDFDKVGDNE